MKTLRILQINLNKSETAHLELINTKLSSQYDIILIQEPHTTTFGNIRTPTNFRQVYPSSRLSLDTAIRSGIWVNKGISTTHWKELPIPGTNDISAVQIRGDFGKISIFNVYNPCRNTTAEEALKQYLTANGPEICATESDHMIWAGDFNRHHPLWDRDEDTHLFTREALADADNLLELLGEYGMVMALPKGIPTLQHMVTKRYSRPDNVFCSGHTLERFTECDVNHDERPAKTDHFPIKATLGLDYNAAEEPPRYNFRTTDWIDFREDLATRLNGIQQPRALETEAEYREAVEKLTEILQDTIRDKVQKTKPMPDCKRWWNSDVEESRKAKNRISGTSFKNRTIPDHPSHQQKTEAINEFAKEVLKAKRENWSEYLLDANTKDLWTANRYMRDPVGDGGRPRIPTLTTYNEYDEETEITSNEEKAKVFANSFFPPAPATSRVPRQYNYPDPLPNPPPITEAQIQRNIARLSPYKACGPDEIPNIVLQKALPLIINHLLYIFQATISMGFYHDDWKIFTTIVLRKPGKPNYGLAKAYRPIALLNTTAKVLTAIVAEEISYLVEKHDLLPQTHFGGRPGRTTTDAIHYLTCKIKDAWRRGKVASILFLDVEGAFPNAVTDQLIHNLQRRKIPKAYINLIKNMLTGRKTRLKFDDFVSELIRISNGIGQGDPLSMILYILYNADLLELIEEDNDEDAVGYVDDVAVIAIGDSLNDTTDKLADIMNRRGGGLEWSFDHNSKFEITKSVIMHTTRDRNDNPEEHPYLELEGEIVKEVKSFKYLGIHIDSQLRWNVQLQKATEKATKWVLNYKRLTRPSTGVNAKLMRQLYIATVLPKMTYGLEAWYTPPTKPLGYRQNIGSVAALRQLTKIQRMATLTITGAMRSTPSDLLDAHAGILPMKLALAKICHRSAIRLATLPESHPLRKIIQDAYRTPPRRHKTAIDEMLRIFDVNPEKFERIKPAAKPPGLEPPFQTSVAQSREESMKREREDIANIKVFTDGSGYEGQIGAAAIIFNNGVARPESTLRYNLGNKTEHTTYDAEIVGGILAMRILKKANTTAGDTISIYTDNQSMIEAAKHLKPRTGQILLTEMCRLAQQIPGKITINWISGHTDVAGNEEADRQAKEASTGESSPNQDLPLALRKPLGISVAAEKQAYHSKLKKKWTEIWDASPRKQKFSDIDPNFPFSKYRKISEGLNRAQTSMLMQIRTGHIPLNYRLHKFGKSETDKCPNCRDRRGGQRARETVDHLIFECRAYQQERNTMFAAMGTYRPKLADLTSDTTKVKALLKYIADTKRFKGFDSALLRRGLSAEPQIN